VYCTVGAWSRRQEKGRSPAYEYVPLSSPSVIIAGPYCTIL
jgi:hypothetical protein